MPLLNPYALLGAVLLALGLTAGGYQWGASATDNAWQAKQAKADQAAQSALEVERKRADAAAGHYLRDLLDRNESYAQLAATHDDLLGRTPLVVTRRVVTAQACPAPAGAPPAAAEFVAGPPGSAPAAAPDPLGGDLDLTLAAVRVWNGALTGTDAAAGACGTAGATPEADAACAQSAGLGLRDAWDNHRVNARSCAEDRHRYQALIDHLSEK